MLSLVHLSDLHFSDIEPGSDVALRDAIQTISPDLIVVSGDLTLSGRTSEFVHARRFLDTLTPPKIVVPGNHDIPTRNLSLRFMTPLSRYRRHICQDIAPNLREGGVAMIGLNSARPWDLSWNWSHGRLSLAQIELADRFFEANADAELRCLVVHHPLVLPEGMTGFRIIGRSEQLLEMLNDRRVDLVLAGHLHKGFWRAHSRSHIESPFHTLVVQASTATSHRRRDEPNAFNAITLNGGQIQLTPWLRDEHTFTPHTPTTFNRSTAGWALLEEEGQSISDSSLRTED